VIVMVMACSFKKRWVVADSDGTERITNNGERLD